MTQPDTTRYRLADATAVEPLINRFVAWSDLVSPLPYSLHVANYQVKALESYLRKPEIHTKAAKNPKLAGGAYVDVPAERAPEVAALLDSIRRDQEANLRFARVATDFQNHLAKEATGQSIEPFYAELPAELRGYVELLYDYFNHPIVRFMESFLYRGPYYRKDLQSLQLFRQPSDHWRRFFLSTPRLPAPDQIHWPVAFADDRVDRLFALDLEPQPLAEIRDLLGLAEADDAALLPLLDASPAPPPRAWDGPGVRVRYYGHACVLIEHNGASVMTDPWLGVLSGERVVDRFSYRDLPPRIDYALISHGHHDHFVLETLLRLRRRIGTLVVPRSYGMFYADTSLRQAAEQCGFENVREVDALDSIPLPGGGEIIAVPFFGEHADLAHGKSGYVVRAGGERILLAADSNCLDEAVYEGVRRATGDIQTAFLGMECVGAPLSWLYGALLPIKVQQSHDQSRRTQACDARRARQLLAAIGCRRAFNYAMGSEPWLEYSMGLGDAQESPQVKESNVFVAAARAQGLEAERLFGKYETYLGSD